ncbi:hypothetical protein [Paraburkholderia sp. C35]|uniref:hypothetical protein n=1 Tax=Paraburkholderia sp. C35 TaxID=2126993 RepID=UPI000D69C401|nr:hypothetical protein [Paraburkholderia sp. C35]
MSTGTSLIMEGRHGKRIRDLGRKHPDNEVPQRAAWAVDQQIVAFFASQPGNAFSKPLVVGKAIAGTEVFPRKYLGAAESNRVTPQFPLKLTSGSKWPIGHLQNAQLSDDNSGATNGVATGA